MHIQICALRCHFNWLKSFNWQQRGENGGSFQRRSGLAWKSRQSVCHAKHLSGFVYQACSGVSTLAANVTVALWLSVQWTCCFGEKAGGWYPTYLITDDVHHTSPTDFAARQPSEKERMLDICKQGLTDVAADDLWGSAEDPCHMHATELKGIRLKAGTQQDTVGQICSHLINSFICSFAAHSCLLTLGFTC